MTFAILAVAASSASARFSVSRIDPPHWFAGMHDTTLQLQVNGPDVANTEVTLADYPGVRLDSVVRLDGSPAWQHIYLTVSPEVRPGKLRLTWRQGKQKVTRDYELRARKEQRGAQGFTSADVLYLVMPDRFANGDTANDNPAGMTHRVAPDRSNPNTRHGGDIKGIIDHLGYIDSLGMTAVWVNPVLNNDMPGGSYHGYATTDYYAIDPRFGTNAEYAALSDSLHNRGMKSVMDMIFNHCGSAHPWALDPPASDWFNHQGDYRQTNYRLSTLNDPYASDRDKDLTVNGWFVEEMPDLNQNNPHLMRYLIQNSIFWIEEAQIDGIRMDTYSYADPEAMKRWIVAVKAEYPAFNIVGECWLPTSAGAAYWQEGSPLAAATGFDSGLPTVMDFPLVILARDLAPFTAQTDSWNGLNTLYDHFALDYVYPDPLRVLRFLDNHDTERVLTTPAENLGPWKQAMTLLLTAPGIPQVYYGTELLMSGTRAGGDGNVRKDMPGGFSGDTTDSFTPAGRTGLQNEAYDFLARVAGWRKTSKAVAEGKMKHFLPDNGLYVYTRYTPDDRVTVLLNGRDEAVTTPLDRYAEILTPGASYTDILTGTRHTLEPDGEITLPPRAILILQQK